MQPIHVEVDSRVQSTHVEANIKILLADAIHMLKICNKYPRKAINK
jgi:hypothetical protein